MIQWVWLIFWLVIPTHHEKLHRVMHAFFSLMNEKYTIVDLRFALADHNRNIGLFVGPLRFCELEEFYF